MSDWVNLDKLGTVGMEPDKTPTKMALPGFDLGVNVRSVGPNLANAGGFKVVDTWGAPASACQENWSNPITKTTLTAAFGDTATECFRQGCVWAGSINKFWACFSVTFSGSPKQTCFALSDDGISWDYTFVEDSTFSGGEFGYAVGYANGWIFTTRSVNLGGNRWDVYVRSSQDGETWAEHLLPQPSWARNTFDRTFFDGTYYWITGCFILTNFDPDGVFGWRTTDPAGGVWEVVEQQNMTFTGGTMTPGGATGQADITDWMYSPTIGKYFLAVEMSGNDIPPPPTVPTSIVLWSMECYVSTDGVNWTYILYPDADTHRSCRARWVDNGTSMLLCSCRSGTTSAGDDNPWVFSTSGVNFIKHGELPQNDEEQFESPYYNNDQSLPPISSSSLLGIYNNANYQIGYLVCSQDQGANWQKTRAPWNFADYGYYLEPIEFAAVYGDTFIAQPYGGATEDVVLTLLPGEP